MSGQINSDARTDAAIIGRRAAPRLRLSLPARLQTMFDTRSCILLDLSRTGAQLGLKKPLQKGESAVLQLQGIDQFGEIVRLGEVPSGAVNGLQFDNGLSEADVLAVRRYAETLENDQARALRREARAFVAGMN